MTQIQVEECEDKITIVVKGHSGYAPRGEDIVCAGISTLSFTLLRVVRDSEVDFVEYGQSDGFMWLSFPLTDDLRAIAHAICAGYKLLSEKYPENVSLRFLPKGGEILLDNMQQ